MELIDNIDDFPCLPDGWEYKKLEDIVDDARGISYGVVQPGSYDPNGVPIIRVNNLKRNSIIDKDILRISPEIESKHIRTRLLGGEILLSLVGSLGECAIVSGNLAGWNVARAIAVIPVIPKFGAKWVELCLRSPIIQHYIRTWATTTVQATLNLRDLSKLMIPCPPKCERDNIARILGSLDDKIEANRRMNETLEAMAQAIFKSWFVDFDPVRAKADGRAPAGMDAETAALFPDSFEETELGMVPMGWKLKSLNEIANFLNGPAMQKFPPESEDFLPVIKIAELHRGNTIGSDRASSNIDSHYIIEDGDLLFSWSGSLEVCIWCGGKGALNQHLFKVTSTEYPMWFLYFWLKEHLPEFQLIAAGKATTMGHIQRYHLNLAKVIVPEQSLLEKTGNIIESIMQLVIKNNIESRNIILILDSLLPNLISGKLRTSEAI